MKRKRLLQTAPCPALQTDGRRIMAVSQLVIIDDKVILNIDLFHSSQLRARYFADRNENQYAAYVNGAWSDACLANVVRMAESGQIDYGPYAVYLDDTVWATDTDHETARKYLGSSVEFWEDSVRFEKRKAAQNRKMDRIDAMMAETQPVPADMDAWLASEIFPENYLFCEMGEKTVKYQCTACGAEYRRKKLMKHNEYTECPHCGAKAQVKRRQSRISRREYVYLFQPFRQQEWIERGFWAECVWQGIEKRIELREEIRAIIPKGRTYGKVWYGQHYEMDEFGQDWWDSNPINKHFREGRLYPGNLEETLRYGNLENSGLDILASKGIKIDINKFVVTFHKRPYMEYLIKSGLTRLAKDIIKIYGWWGDPMPEGAGNLKELLGINGERVNRLKQLNGGLRAWEWLIYEEEIGERITRESLGYLDDHGIGRDQAREMLDSGLTVNRMVNYLKKQKTSPGRTITLWNDYLRMAASEGLNVGDDIIRFPRDLKGRHDVLVEIINARRDAERVKRDAQRYADLNKQIEKNLSAVRRYFWENEDYIIIPAGKCEELVAEGQALHHCVGASNTYMERMAQGDSWILFLRRKSDIETPYYTIEIGLADDKIRQYYSEYDRQPDKKEISRVLSAYKDSLGRSRERIRATA